MIKLYYQPSTNLMINYLPNSMTEQKLSIIFSAFGELLRCKVVYDPKTGKSRCYGFVEFEDEWDADRALEAINGYMIQDKQLKVSFAFKRGSGHCNDEPMTHEQNTNLYVQNLPLTYTDNDLITQFIKFGQIAESTILRNINGISKGVGFVRYH